MEQVPDGLELTAFDETFHKDPYAVYERLRRLDPIHEDKASLWGKSWTISGYEYVKTLFSDTRLSVDPRTIGLRRDPRADNAVTLREPNMMSLDGDDHRRLRSLVQQAFTPGSVERFRSEVREIADKCLDAVTDNEFDVVSVLAKPLPTIGIATYIGVDPARHEDFKRWTDSLLLQGYPMPTEEQWQEIVAADAALRDYAMSVIAARREAPRDDLVTRLIDAKEAGDLLSENEIVDMCCLLIGAGNFTTTDLISNTIHMLLTTDASAEDAVEACLRFDAPVLNIRRYVTEDIEIGGKLIEKGSVVNLLVGAANHDPENLDKRHLTFGQGLHHCLGAPLAKLEAEVALEAFQERFPNAQLVSAKRARRMDFRGFTSLVVQV